MDDYDIEDLADGFYIEIEGDWYASEEDAYPSAGPVIVTRADGTVEVEPPVEGGDRPQ